MEKSQIIFTQFSKKEKPKVSGIPFHQEFSAYLLFHFIPIKYASIFQPMTICFQYSFGDPHKSKQDSAKHEMKYASSIFFWGIPQISKSVVFFFGGGGGFHNAPPPHLPLPPPPPLLNPTFSLAPPLHDDDEPDPADPKPLNLRPIFPKQTQLQNKTLNIHIKVN